MNAKQTKQFFLVILVAAILGTLTSCSERKSRSGQLHQGVERISIDNAQILVTTGVFKPIGDSTLAIPTAIIGTGTSKIYKTNLYKLSRAEAVYVRLNY